MREPDRIGDVVSFDGTRLRYQEFGAGPPIVIGNGIGVGYRGLVRQIEHFRGRHRLITWDQRGFFDSGAPGPGGTSVSAHARDCVALMDALGVREAAYLGWSMGVQIGVEAVRVAPRRFTRLALLAGVAGRPARAAVPLPIDGIAAKLVRGARLAARRTLWRQIGHPRALDLARLMGFVHSSVDGELFLAMVRAVAGHDPAIYLETLAELLLHDASDLLPEIDVPVLFLAGERDRMTGPRTLTRLARMTPRGSSHVVREGSHFALIERPDEVNRVLEAFFRG